MDGCETFEFEFLTAEEANEIATTHNIKPRDVIKAYPKYKDSYIGGFLKIPCRICNKRNC